VAKNPGVNSDKQTVAMLKNGRFKTLLDIEYLSFECNRQRA
jgi:hypothetical protein